MQTCRCVQRFYATDSKGKGPAQDSATAKPVTEGAAPVASEGQSGKSISAIYFCF